jgi:hypothetical protein
MAHASKQGLDCWPLDAKGMAKSVFLSAMSTKLGINSSPIHGMPGGVAPSMD